MYDMYRSYLDFAPFYTKVKWCNNKEKTKKIKFNRRVLTRREKEKIYNVENYWLEHAYRFRLLEMKHDLTPGDINLQIQNAKSVYKIRGQMHALKFLHNKVRLGVGPLGAWIEYKDESRLINHSSVINEGKNIEAT